MSRIILSAASRVGNVRSNNEDMVLAFDRFVRSDVYATEFMTGNSDRFVIALADGMGGHNAGEVASSDVLTNLRFFGRLAASSFDGRFLRDDGGVASIRQSHDSLQGPCKSRNVRDGHHAGGGDFL